MHRADGRRKGRVNARYLGAGFRCGAAVIYFACATTASLRPARARCTPERMAFRADDTHLGFASPGRQRRRPPSHRHHLDGDGPGRRSGHGAAKVSRAKAASAALPTTRPARRPLKGRGHRAHDDVVRATGREARDHGHRLGPIGSLDSLAVTSLPLTLPAAALARLLVQTGRRVLHRG
jgi:hypothetical protein